MDKPLDELYLEWLYSQVGDLSLTNPTHTYWRILKILNDKPFRSVVKRDVNRIEDGKELREQFAGELRLNHVDPNWMELPCSILELMVALSRRLAFEGEGEPHEWFWELIHNLDLQDCNDRRRFSAQRVDEILERLIERDYAPDGKGGFFPLHDPQEDQRLVEIRYQQAAYLIERLS